MIKFPKEKFNLREAKGKDFYSIMMVNRSLKNYKFKEEYPWYLWISIDLEDIQGDFKLPTDNESKILNQLEDYIMSEISKSNTHYIGRITSDGKRELYIQLQYPDVANTKLQEIINSNKYEREFEFYMEEDASWANVDFFWKGV